MKNRLLFIGYNFSPELTGIGKYSGEMMKWLAEQGYDCTALVAYPYYPHWRVQEPYYTKRFSFSNEVQRFESGGSLTICRCPMYVPAQPSGLKRILLDSSFLFTAFLRLLPLLFGKKFDVVISVAPSFQLGLLSILYKKIRGARTVYHIQDLQIEAARDLKMIANKRILQALFRTEKYIFDYTDYLSSISDSMVEKVSSKANKPALLFPNWSDINIFHPLPPKGTIKQAFGFQPNHKLIVYSGAIGEKQGLEAILYAAQEFRQEADVLFLICGSGPYKEELIKLAQHLGLTNVRFLPLQPVEKFNDFLNMADVHLIIQKATASDLVMPSKLTTILAVGGLALITANEDSGLYSLVRKHQMGLLVAAENQQALNAGIAQALRHDHSDVRRNARAYAERYLSIDTIMQSFEAAALRPATSALPAA